MTAVAVESTEGILVEIWREVLGVEHVGVHDDFFALGGTSLTAVKIAARAATAFEVDLGVEAVFEAPTVAALAALVDAAGHVARAAPSRRPRRREPQLSDMQRDAWAQEVCSPDLRSHITEAFQVDGPLDVAALESALSEVVRRHEVLRTVLARVAHRAQPRVLAAEPMRIPIVEVARAPRQRREAEIRQQVRAAQGDAFDLATAPPLRVVLVRSAPASHVLVVTVHEIVCDGVGFAVLLEELSRLYAAYSAGRPSPLEEPALQYADCVQLQRDQPHDAGGEAHWADHCRRAPLALPFPFEAGGLVQSSEAYIRVETMLPPEVTAGLGELARREAATPAMLCLTVFGDLLRRHSGEASMVVDVPSAQRSRVELEGVVGFFSRVLPVWLDLGGDPTVRDALRRTRDAMLAALRHADALPEPLRRRDAAGCDLEADDLKFRYWDEATAPHLELAGARTKRVLQPGEVGGVVLELTETGAGTRCQLSSSAAGLGEAVLKRMLDRYVGLLRDVAARPDAHLGELTCLDAAERKRLAADRIPRRGGGDDGDCLHRLVRARLEEDPDAISLHAPEGEISRRALDARAAAFAAHLRSHGVREGAVVGLALEPSTDLLAALLAVLGLGAAVAPLEPARAPAAALAAIDLLVVRGPRPATYEGPVAELTAQEAEIAAAGAGDAAQDAGADDPGAVAVVLPTAGVSGAPKLVRLQHRTLAHLSRRQRDAHRLRPSDRALDVPGPGVRAWALAALMHLANGVQIVVPSEPAGTRAADLARAIARDRVTVCGAPVAMVSALLAERPDCGGSLRLLRALGAGTLDLEQDAGALPAVVREYAVAEAGGTVLVARKPTGAARIYGGGPEEAGVAIQVLDADGRLAPPGVAGELWVEGCGAGDGDAPVPGDRAERPEPRMVATGDLARRHADGSVELLGRRCDEVRFRGFRLNAALAEVEAALVRHPAVREAASCWDAATASAVAFVVPGTAGLPDLADLDRWVRRVAADAVAPARYAIVERMPRRADGTLDHAALAPLVGGGDEPGPRTGGRTGAERKILSIWRKLLGRRRIGAEESFFALGGDLYLGVEMIGRANDAGLALGPGDLLRGPTIRKLAAAAEDGGAGRTHR